MSNDRQRRSEQTAAAAPAAPLPPEWVKHLERLVDAAQALVPAVTELAAAVGRMTTRADEMYVENGKEHE